MTYKFLTHNIIIYIKINNKNIRFYLIIEKINNLKKQRIIY